MRNEVYGDELGVESMEVTIQRRQLRWLKLVTRKGEERMARKVHEAKEDGERKRGRPRKTWVDGKRLPCDTRALE